ncbi:MAG: YcaO-like family protein [Spirochaetota bacterium]|nr:YcaO-like family protein [Spirochaetota bacterium]
MENILNHEIILQPRSKKFKLDGSHRYLEPEQTIRMIKSNPEIKEIILNSTLLKDKKFDVPIYFFMSTILGESELHECIGKGLTDSQSYCSGIIETIEHYCCSIFKEDSIICDTYDQLKENAVDPETLGVFRDGVYSPSLPIDWIWAWNLTRRENVLVPALSGLCISLACNHYYFSSNDDKTMYTASDSNGCAAGNCMEEAILHGIYEVIERDAIIINARNNLRPPDIKITRDVRNRYLHEILDKLFADKNIIFKIKYLTLDINMPTFGCVLLDKNLGYPVIGYGTHFDPEIALQRAITELFQARAINQRQNKTSMKLKGVKLSQLQYLWETGHKTISLSDINDISTDDINEDIKLAVRMIKKENMDVIIVNRTKKNIGIPVVKVIVPGAQRLDWSWLYDKNLVAMGSNRIFNVPVKLKLSKKKRKLSSLDINQITFG